MNNIKKYRLNIIIKVMILLMSSLFIFIGIALIITTPTIDKDATFYFSLLVLLLIIFIIFSVATMRIEIYDNYLLFKHLHLKAKISFNEIVDVTSEIIMWRLYFIRYYKDGKLVRHTLFPMQNMYDLLNEIKKGNPNIVLEERIKLKINKLKSKGKIS